MSFSRLLAVENRGFHTFIAVLQIHHLVCFLLPGIWPDGADGTDVNSVDRSKGKQLVATGDDFGNVNLYRYPCVNEKVRIPFILLCNVIFLL